MGQIYQDRLARVTSAMQAQRCEALLLCSGADMLYLTGFEHGHAQERLLALVLRADGSGTWISPTMNVPQVREHLLPGQELLAWTDAETYRPALVRATAGAKRLLFDDEARAAFLIDLLDLGIETTIGRASSLMRGVRIRKDAAELTAMRAAAKTVDDTIAEAISFCRPGRRESDVEADLRGVLLRRSPECEVAFTIIGSGPNAALPHHETGRRELRQGDVVILDFGTRREGYHSDITVTCSVGEPADEEVRKVYRTVWEAQQKALEAIRPGVPCEAIDRAARSQIEASGYGEFFIHRTGHGLGLQVHEPPYLVAGNTEVLEEGMTFSIEPGIYLPGRFGVRLEVIAAVAADGVSPINAPSAPELPVVPV